MLAEGSTKASIWLAGGLQIDLRVLPAHLYGNLLQHFTGGREHNIQFRELAVRKGLRVSENGILDLAIRREPDVPHRGRGVRRDRARLCRAGDAPGIGRDRSGRGRNAANPRRRSRPARRLPHALDVERRQRRPGDDDRALRRARLRVSRDLRSLLRPRTDRARSAAPARTARPRPRTRCTLRDPHVVCERGRHLGGRQAGVSRRRARGAGLRRRERARSVRASAASG